MFQLSQVYMYEPKIRIEATKTLKLGICDIIKTVHQDFLLQLNVLTLCLPTDGVAQIVYTRESLDHVNFSRVLFHRSYHLYSRGEKILGIAGFQTGPARLEPNGLSSNC